jgi:hypothetical protein
VTIPGHALERFIQNFKPVDRELFGEVRLGYGYPFDVLLLVRSTTMVPRLRITLCEIETAHRRKLIPLFDHRKNSTWTSWVEQNVTKATYNIGSNNLLKLEVKAQAGRSWMPWVAGERSRTRAECDTVLAWTVEVGLSGIVAVTQLEVVVK